MQLGPFLWLRPDEVFDQFRHRRRSDLLREVGAAGAQHPGDLVPPDVDGVTAAHQVERLIGERQPWLIAGPDDHHAARMQKLGGQRRVRRPRFGRDHGGREFLGAREHLAATGVDIACGRDVRQAAAQQPLVAPGRSFLRRPAVQPREIPTVDGYRIGFGHQIFK